MAYEKTVWQERIAENKNRFMASGAVSGEMWMTNAPTNVTQPGTPFSVEHMNKIEEGIFAAHKAIDDHLEKEPFGYLISFTRELTVQQLSDWRCLPLQGQVMTISGAYQRLFDWMYCGNAANETAPWWYKSSDPDGLIRDVNGVYMRVLDHRGIFTRPAGQNSYYTMANDAPYDGKGIGEFIGDVSKRVTGSIVFSGANDSGFLVSDVSGVFDKGNWVSGGNIFASVASPGQVHYHGIYFDAGSGDETAPASISSFLCVRY